MTTGHPGLFVQEVAPNISTIQPVPTSIAGFVGICQKGAVNTEITVTSWNDFVRQCGTFIPSSYLAYAVKGFFDNGGTKAIIVRSTHINNTTGDTSVVATYTLKDSQATPLNCVTVNASSNGTWGNAITVGVANAAWGASYWKLLVYLSGVLVESWDNLSNDSTNARYAQAIVNGVSNYVSLSVLESTQVPANVSTPVALTGGVDGIAGIVDTDYVGSSSTAPMNTPTGLYVFDTVVGGVNLIAIPGVTTQTVQIGIQTYVEGKNPQSVFAILDPPMGQTVTQIATYRQTTAAFNTDNAALFYPNIIVSDPIGVGTNPKKTIPPSGHIAGMIARTDSTRGVWKAPAGTEATLLGALDTEYHVQDTDQDTLNPIGINAIRVPAPGVGIVSWGTRTLTTTKPDYNTIPVRREVQMIESTLNKNLLWAVFEPNNQVLWNRINASITQFLTGIWKDGGLSGTKASEAFQVTCDSSNNTTVTIEQGYVYVDIAVAPVRPAEFVTFRIGLKQ